MRLEPEQTRAAKRLGMPWQESGSRGAWRRPLSAWERETYRYSSTVILRKAVSQRDLAGANPAFRGGYAFANLRELFPEPLSRAFMEGMEGFGTMIRGFDRPDAILAGIESRTSSPVRIPRDQGMESPVKGIFPCGEGAGYAGGITSAAMDGIKTAEEIIRRYSPLRPSRTAAKT